jgi:hypothetical protein
MSCDMGLAATLDHLAKARKYAADGKKLIARQRALIDRLEQQDLDTLDAILFLEYLEEQQEQYAEHRNRLEQQVLDMLRPVAE